MSIPLRFGVLGVAKIATTKVIPAMLKSAQVRLDAIASRDLAKAREAAARFGIPRAHGSYDALLADPGIDAVYIALPNHLHVPWTRRAAEAGKHVLCEKPIGLTADEAESLIAVRDRTHVQVQEAFMVRTHPQWQRAIEIVRSGRIGEVRALSGVFSFRNDDPQNIRNIAGYGGGALLDIGCYLVLAARWVFDREPSRVRAMMIRDPSSGVDRVTSVILDFGSGHAVGTCSTQQVPYQRVQILGTTGRVEIEIPFNAPPDRPCRIFVSDGSDPVGVHAATEEFAVCDQYTIEVDRFAEAVRGPHALAMPLEESVLNLRVMDAITRAAGE